MYRYLYIYIYIYLHTHTHTHIYIYIYIYIYVCVYIPKPVTPKLIRDQVPIQRSFGPIPLHAGSRFQVRFLRIRLMIYKSCITHNEES